MMMITMMTTMTTMTSRVKTNRSSTPTVARCVGFQRARRGRAMIADAKKKRRGGGGGGGSDDYSADFALYGSFDESYAEGAGMLLGKKQLNSASGKRRGGGGSGGGSYDAVAGVLEALASERRSRNKYRRDDDDQYYEEGEEDEEYFEEEEGNDGTDSPSSDARPRQPQSTSRGPRQQQQRMPSSAAKPKPQPQRPRPTAAGQAKANAQPKASTDPAETRAKALTTMQKWGFTQSDLEAAFDATSASVGDAATAKKRQIAALDWLLVNCPMDAVPDEYKLEAQQARA